MMINRPFQGGLTQVPTSTGTEGLPNFGRLFICAA